MLFILLLAIPCIASVENEETNVPKPYVILPLPLDLPNRNDRAEQCWLRIEDIELTETLAVYCHIAEAFLHYFIHEYNTRKMIEDKVDVSLWNEKPRSIEDIPVPRDDAEVRTDNENTLIDWKWTTIEDPTIHRRFYVTKKADCRLIMYSRDGMSNYQVECGKVLYFINVRMNSCAVYKGNVEIFVIALFILLFNSL
ncbi:uncharacterized protein LOC120624216 [Pararge aegeria]|uniref:Jg3274 protein n=1 Tax=Pararge aegeria aegeria TaxID=348720 RepID=A0A8S4RSE9_9NEOP|nr:uncharacterized protein LOC120624216 [Pararge aegeria]CAH2241209.1 jg3274 [Pararge aegeria aegeria]